MRQLLRFAMQGAWLRLGTALRIAGTATIVAWLFASSNSGFLAWLGGGYLWPGRAVVSYGTWAQDFGVVGSSQELPLQQLGWAWLFWAGVTVTAQSLHVMVARRLYGARVQPPGSQLWPSYAIHAGQPSTGTSGETVAQTSSVAVNRARNTLDHYDYLRAHDSVCDWVMPRVSVTKMAERLRNRGLFYEPTVLQSAVDTIYRSGTLLLAGSPGNGKSELAVALASEFLGRDCKDEKVEPTIQWLPSDVLGRVDERGLALGVVGRAIVSCRLRGGRNWLIIDELNRCMMQIAYTGLYGLLDGLARRDARFGIGGMPILIVPETFRLVCTMNDGYGDNVHPSAVPLLQRLARVSIAMPGDALVMECLHYAYRQVARESPTRQTAKHLEDYLGVCQLVRRQSAWLGSLFGVRELRRGVERALQGPESAQTENFRRRLDEQLVEHLSGLRPARLTPSEKLALRALSNSAPLGDFPLASGRLARMNEER